MIKRSLTQPVVWLALLILLGQTVLLTHQLADQAQWSDEMFTTRVVYMPTIDAALAQIRLTETRPPLHYLILWAWGRIAGMSEWAVRFISIAATLLATALAFRLAADLISPRAAVWAMLLTATAPSVLLHGRIMRGYAAVAPLVLLSTLAFWRARETSSWRYKLIYLISTATFLFTDYLAVPVVGAHMIILVGDAWRTRRDRNKSRPISVQVISSWIVVLAGLTLTMVALLAFMRSQVGSGTAQGNFSGLSLSTALARAPHNLPNGMAGVAMLVYLFSVGEAILPWHPLAIPAVLIAVSLSALGWWTLWRTHRRAAIFLAVIIAVPILFNATIVFTLLLPPSMLVIGAARSLYLAGLLFIPASVVFETRAAQRWVWVALCVWLAARGVSVFNQLEGHDYLNPVHEVNARVLAQQVAHNIQPGDQVIFEEPLAFDFYFRELDATTPLYTTGDNHIGYAVAADVMPDDPTFSGQNQRFIAALPPERLLAALRTAPPPRLWLVIFQHEGEEQTVEQEIALPLAQTGRYRLVSRLGFAPQDPLYAQLRARLRSRTPIAYKAEIALYERVGP